MSWIQSQPSNKSNLTSADSTPKIERYFTGYKRSAPDELTPTKSSKIRNTINISGCLNFKISSFYNQEKNQHIDLDKMNLNDIEEKQKAKTNDNTISPRKNLYSNNKNPLITNFFTKVPFDNSNINGINGNNGLDTSEKSNKNNINNIDSDDNDNNEHNNNSIENNDIFNTFNATSINNKSLRNNNIDNIDNTNSNNYLNNNNLISIRINLHQNHKTFLEKSINENKITNYINYEVYGKLNGLNKDQFLNVLKFLSIREIARTNLTFSKQWTSFTKSIYQSYDYFSTLHNLPNKHRPPHIIDKELCYILSKKESKLRHIRLLNKMIHADFCNKAQNLLGKNNIYLKIANNDMDINQSGVLLQSFKIKPKGEARFNLLSYKSIDLLCLSSFYSLKELTIRNNDNINCKIAERIASCKMLEKLDLSCSE